jgi:acyl carrier protein
MTPEQARTAVRTALHEVAADADLDTLPDDAGLQETLELDSLDFLRLVELLSETTGVRIDEEDYPRLATMGSAVAWLSTVDVPV